MPRPSQFPIGNYIPALIATGVSSRQALLFARGQTENMSASALETLRASNVSSLEGVGGIRSQNFNWQWGSVQKSQALADRLGSVDIAHVRSGSEIVQGRFPRARGFQANVNLLVRDLRTNQEYFTPMGVVSDSVLAEGEYLVQAANNLRSIQSQAHMSGNRDTLPIQILSGGYVTDVIERMPLLPDGDDE